MSNHLLLQWDLGVVDEIIAEIETAFHQRYGLVNARGKLTRLRDELRELVEAFAYCGDDLDAEAFYHFLFDGLSHLTEALRGRAVNPQSLRWCSTSLSQAVGLR